MRGLAARHLPGSWKTVEGELRHNKATVVFELDLELKAGSTLRGRVVTSGGAPVAGADVRLERKGMRRSAETDADGEGEKS